MSLPKRKAQITFLGLLIYIYIYKEHLTRFSRHFIISESWVDILKAPWYYGHSALPVEVSVCSGLWDNGHQIDSSPFRDPHVSRDAGNSQADWRQPRREPLEIAGLQRFPRHGCASSYQVSGNGTCVHKHARGAFVSSSATLCCPSGLKPRLPKLQHTDLHPDPIWKNGMMFYVHKHMRWLLLPCPVLFSFETHTQLKMTLGIQAQDQAIYLAPWAILVRLRALFCNCSAKDKIWNSDLPITSTKSITHWATAQSSDPVLTTCIAKEWSMIWVLGRCETPQNCDHAGDVAHRTDLSET